MNKNYIQKVAESKIQYHKHKSQISFEEKINTIIELQKLDFEFLKNGKRKSKSNKIRIIWNI
jgi:hypothetical protein